MQYNTAENKMLIQKSLRLANLGLKRALRKAEGSDLQEKNRSNTKQILASRVKGVPFNQNRRRRK